MSGQRRSFRNGKLRFRWYTFISLTHTPGIWDWKTWTTEWWIFSIITFRLVDRSHMLLLFRYIVCVCVSIRIIDKLCNEIAADAHTHSHRNIFEIVAVFYHKHRLSYTQTQIRLPSSIPRRTYVIRTLYRPVCIVWHNPISNRFFRFPFRCS